MATGRVTKGRKIVIPVEVFDDQHASVLLEAIVDTGFNGSLTLPNDVLNSLMATEAGTHRVELGDGGIVEMEVYFIDANCFGSEREVQVIKSESEPLLACRCCGETESASMRLMGERSQSNLSTDF